MKKIIFLFILTISLFLLNHNNIYAYNCENSVNEINKWDILFDKKEYLIAIDKYKLALDYYCNDDSINFIANYNLALSYYNIKNNKDSLIYFEKALLLSNNTSDNVKINEFIKILNELIKDDNLKKTSATNDPFSYKQYYLRSNSIINAWGNIKNSIEVKVAVIDDWVWISAPDLKDNILWSVINFTWDWLYNYADWDHWTMVSWIIWAKINNNIWIAGISPNVKIMPLRVFWSWSIANEEKIIDAINYAIDNNANIINLSLWHSQFYETKKFDETIKNAYNKWIIIIIAAWNWDNLSWNEAWLDTTINPIYPICNNWWESKYSLWVWALKQNWDKTNWSNYGKCVTFWLAWENITSTSIPIYNLNSWNDYNIWSWTSFSAPILSWIIALWYNKYWYIPFEIIKEELNNSIDDFSWNDVTWTEKVIKQINAEKYLKNLWKRIEEIKNAQSNINNLNWKTELDNNIILKEKTELVFNKIKIQLNKKTQIQKINYYNSLLKKLNVIKDKLSWDKSIIVNHLIYLINKEIKK